MTERVERLFHELADLSAEERERYFAEHDVDDETRRQAEALLRFDSGNSALLDRDIALTAGQALSMLDGKDSRCGNFRLASVIGRGGMGVVYLAERVDGELDQRAAVKLLQPGLSESQNERFLQERQILAGLAHPNIARLLDAGRREDGQPFLAMEYIEGKPIDLFAARLNLRQKIRLFLKVCAAVAYLHRHLVVHRDLKPSNILVTEEGEPKLLDFGIAKMLDLATDSTVTGMRMLTPDYASPEQVMGDRVSTTSDVYSLGAVLFHLLTGSPPHRFEDPSPGAIASVILKQPVTRPSVLAPALKGDLDYILLKALRKEPQERYSTVEQMVEELESFLESRPIRARRGELLYRARKFARRYWLPVAAAALAIAGLSVGLYVADRERAIAQRRFQEVRELANQLFAIDREVAQVPGGSKIRQLIVDTSLDYLRRLAEDARQDPELALDVGTAYMRVGRVQGVPISANLGQMENAEQNLQIAEGLIRFVLDRQPANRTAFLRMAQIAHDRMVLGQARRPDTAALPLARQSHLWLNKYLDAGPLEEAEQDQVFIAGTNIANWYARKDLPDEGLSLLHRMIRLAMSVGQPFRAGSAQIVVARALRAKGDLDGALAASREAVRLVEPQPGQKRIGHVKTFGLALVTQGEILGELNAVSLGRFQEAAALFERDYRISTDLARQDPNDFYSRSALSASGIRLADVIRDSDSRRAIEIYDEVLARLAEVKDNSRARRDEVRALARSTYPLRRSGRLAEARRRIAAAFVRLRDLKLYPAAAVNPGSEPDDALRALAEYEAFNENRQRGIEVYEQLLHLIQASRPQTDSNLAHANDLSNIYSAMARLYRRAGKQELASEFETRRRDLWLDWDRRLPGNPFVLRQIAETSAAREK